VGVTGKLKMDERSEELEEFEDSKELCCREKMKLCGR
jgi:hypothetical protein